MAEWPEEDITKLIRKVTREERTEIADVIAWARVQIRRAEKRDEMIDKVKGTLVGQLLIWLTVGLGLLVYKAASRWVKDQ